ncbi:MAG: multicopper oxidase family protein [Actinomycetota bacterium]
MKERTTRAPWRNAIGPALLLSVGVVAWEQLLHAARHVEPPGPVAPHLALDAVLALPLAYAAVTLTLQLFRRRSAARAVVASALFTLLLVPAVGAHKLAHKLVAPSGAHVHRSAVEQQSLIAHGFHDALLGLPVALLIALFSIGAMPPAPSRKTAATALAFATVFTTLPGHAAGPVITPFVAQLPIPAVLSGSQITLTAREADVPILPGMPATHMWTYNGTFPGPTIHATAGQPMYVTLVNNLPSQDGDVTMHQHGEHAESQYDGQPHANLIAPGGSYTYHFDYTEASAPERGAMQWYHDHMMDVTGRNIWNGLAGMVILDDPTEAPINAALPSGDRDIPLMVVDRSFDQNAQIDYGTFNPDGRLGDAILVNGAPQPNFNVANVKYRLRILNASNARSYDFKLSDAQPMIQVATKSGLLPAPVTRTHIQLGPAERAEVIVDFSHHQVGDRIVLQNALGFGANLNSAMQFTVTSTASDTSTIPQTLRAAPVFDDTLPLGPTRVWDFGQDPVTNEWTINGNGFDPNRIDAMPKLDTVERWIFINTSSVDHIVHIHDVDWEILSRVLLGSTDTSGILTTEPGLRESFRLRPNEVVTIESKFTDHIGTFVFHCHILEHEDYAMMDQFQVVR